MANPYFQFKKFTLFHDKCAMKIGTDGVLLGAWANIANTKIILDVGTGTGLIAIMLAQRGKAMIDAIEINEAACMQARENISGCPWASRIRLINASFQEYAKDCNKKYDLIVSNPPFYTNQYKPAETTRSVARHDDSLSLKETIFFAEQILSHKGILSVIIPVESMKDFTVYLSHVNLFVIRVLQVIPSPGKPVRRVLIEAGRNKTDTETDSLTIDTGRRHDYTHEYKLLTKDFYLAF